MIAIVDYGAGNLKSVEKAIVHLGETPVASMEPKTILQADKVVLPGVGAFGDAMGRLKRLGLDEVLRQVVKQRTPLLGICLGLQLLFEESEESQGIEGLSILSGKVKRIPPIQDGKIPHMGWNSLNVKGNSRLLHGIVGNPYVYFVHSYYLCAKEEEDVIATTEYATCIHAAVERDLVFACQFHPEKSGDVGLRILKNFIAIE